ncbi:metal-dependent hydrolase [Sulfurimonas indica]|uniref:metal-dependent hydrolase n=1 Tax=Sulfurimonas TaxID=202746 RepID=UPI001262C6F7|nr:metal-dependent hydrolase [Sulfurimonas indica]
MTAKGHMALASVSALVIIEYCLDIACNDIETIDLIAFYFSVIFGSLAPDIDESESYIGRRLYAISLVMSSVFKHRTFTHYLFVPIALFVATYFVQDYFTKLFLYGFSLGILMHDLGDMLTKGGINGFFFPFFPNTKIAILPKQLRFYTNSIAEHIFIVFLLLLNVAISLLIAKSYALEIF